MVQGLNPGGGEIFCVHPDWPRGSFILPYFGYRVFPGVKRQGRGVDCPLPSSIEVKERVELYVYSSFWVFVACSRVNFAFTCITK